MQDVTIFSEPMITRSYTVHVRVSKKTGKVLSIRAGCRRWDNFEEALMHYGSQSRWHDVRNLVDQQVAINENKYTTFRDRTGALLALCRASARVAKYRKWVVARKTGRKASRKRRL